MFCPTSVALNKSVRKDITLLTEKRMQEPIMSPNSMDLRPVIEVIELFRILGINSRSGVNTFILHLLPIMNVHTSGTTADSALHKRWLPLLQLCHGLITDETAKQMILQLSLQEQYSRHLSVILPTELSIIVNGTSIFATISFVHELNFVTIFSC